MIVDTSALASILFQEPDAALFSQVIHEADQCLISAGNFLELGMVVAGQLDVGGLLQCDTLLRQTDIAIEPFTVEQAYLAREAFLNFGKGRHPAGLNLGDCFAYALSKATGEPLLFKGDDFRKTDVVPAI